MTLIHKIQTSNRRLARLGARCILLSLCGTIAVGCDPNDPSIVNNKRAVETEDNRAPEATVTSAAVAKAELRIAKSHGKSTEAHALEENLRNSYARRAANHTDICPKLLQKQVDSSEIIRSNDIMFDQHCDYFIYPQPGQHILVRSNNSLLEALLISPELHSFNNGGYIATSSQKHIIRISYNGIAHDPSPVSYDVVVKIED